MFKIFRAMARRKIVPFLSVLIMGATPIAAQDMPRINILSGPALGTNTHFATDLSDALAQNSQLRMLPYLTSGSIQNLDDLLSTKGKYLAMINADVLISRRVQSPEDERLDDLTYISHLLAHEMHLVVRRRSGLNTFLDLNNKRVATGEIGAGSFLTASLLMRTSGIQAQVISLPNDQGLKALKDGAVDAVFILAGKPSALLQSVTRDENLSLIDVPLSEHLVSIYNSAEISADDYPSLVRGAPVKTISVDVILAAYGIDVDSHNFQAISRIAKTLKSQQSKGWPKSAHPKWAEFSLERPVLGWRRNQAVSDFMQSVTHATDPNIEDLMKEAAE